jgi:membrane-bound lytic murein transglycosylase D
MPAAPGGAFPRPPGLEPQVNFWRHVYAVWGRDKVVVHDDRYMAMVYEVIDLPGEIQESRTDEQKQRVREREGYWKDLLRNLEQKVSFGMPLDPVEQKVADRFAATGGPRAVMGASSRVRTQRGMRERFRRGLEISGRYDSHFREIFRKAGLPEDLAYLPHVESSFQVNARSSVGAVGVWQFTKGAAQKFMVMHPALDERHDPIASARGAARYLSYAYGRLRAWPLAVTSYNHGIGGMERAKSQYGTDFMKIVYYYDQGPFGFASRNFYAEFLAARDIASQPQRYFPEGIRYEPPQAWDRAVLRQSMPVSGIAMQFDVDRERLIGMNWAWTAAARSDRVAVPSGTEVWLPAGTLRRVGMAANRGPSITETETETDASALVPVY